MPVVLRSTSDFSVENGVKIVVYGRAGMGKTRLCGTCPDPVIFSAESGLLTLQQYNIPYFGIYTIADLKDAYNWTRSSNEARQFQTVCLDSISDIAETLLAKYKVDTVTNAGKSDNLSAYNGYNDEIVKVIKEFRDLRGKHVYMSAKQARITRSDGVVLNGPSLPGKRVQQDFPHIPDFLFQAEVHPAEKYYYLRTKADFANDAKDRSGVLDEITEPDLGKIIARVSRRAA